MHQINLTVLAAVLAALLSPLAGVAGPVNVNTASAEAISSELKGVGLSKAQAIVDYRSNNGSFTAPEELLKVKGIGPRVLEDNRADIRVAE